MITFVKFYAFTCHIVSDSFTVVQIIQNMLEIQ